MLRQFFASVLPLCVLWLAPVAAHSQSQLSRLEGVKIDVAVHDMSAYQLLFEIAELTNTNWVVGHGLLDKKISINAKQIDAAALVRQLLAAENLQTVSHNHIDVVTNACRVNSGLGAKAVLPSVKKPGPINFTLPRVDFSAVVYVLADFSKVKLAARPENQTILIRTTNQNWPDVLRALLIAEDMGMHAPAKGSAEPAQWSTYWPQDYACPKPAAPAAKAQAKPASPAFDSCKRKQMNPQSQIPCGPLEYFKTADLAARGYIGLSDTNATPYVLLQAPDAQMFRVKLGDYEFVGEQLGQIISADHEKFLVEEFVQEDGKTYLQTTQIAYTGERKVVEKKAYKRSAAN